MIIYMMMDPARDSALVSTWASTNEETLLEFCRKLPKVELHAHLNGSISPATMEKLIQLHIKRKDDNDLKIPQVWQTTIAKEKTRTLNECFEMFKIIHTIVDTEEALAMVAHDVVREFATDGVVYLELRSTPRANTAKGMSKKAYVEAVLSGIDSAIAECQRNVYVRLLLSVDRRKSIEDAKETVELAEACMKNPGGHKAKVVGIDLSGDPSIGNMEEFLPVLFSAKEKGLKLALHLSEIPGRNAETRMLLDCNPDRIGHGTFLHPKVGGTQEIIDFVSSKKIPIEMCLTSNLKAKTVESYDVHHLGYWYFKKHPLIICTDDKGVFSTSLSEEYSIAARTFSLSKVDLLALSALAVDYIFDEDIKQDLRKLW